MNMSFRLKVGLQTIIFFLLMIGTATAADIEEVRNLIEENYIDEVPGEVLQQDSIDKILDDLDPYSDYFTQSEYEEFEQSINRNYTGIGIVVNAVSDGVEIVSIFKDSPAKSAGLMVGDIIIEADGTSLQGKSVDKATLFFKGEPGTQVNVKVKRPTANTELDVSVKRQDINMPVVEAHKLAGNIGYISLYSFSESAAEKMKEAILSLKDVDGWIIDIRGNGGGYLKTAQKIAGFFPEVENALIVENRDKSQQIYPVEEQAVQFSKPIAMLINGSSASASEIVAGAVQDYESATLYGQTTFGKGLAQTLFDVESGGMLKLSVAEFFTPKGDVINEKGIQPDIKTSVGEELVTAHQDLLLASLDEELDIDAGVRSRYPVFTVQTKSSYDAENLKEKVSLVELGGEKVPVYVHPNSYTSFKITPQQALKSETDYLLLIDSDNGMQSISFVTKKELGSRDLTYIPFKDLELSNYFTGPVMVLEQEKIVTGISEDYFAPYYYLTRQDAAVMFARALDLDTENVSDSGFKDVEGDQYYSGAVAAMKHSGIIKGRSDEIFGTNEILTREEMAAMIARAFDFEESEASSPFLDVTESEFKTDIVTIYELGITTGSTPTTFSPNKVVTRGQFSTFLYRALLIKNGTGTLEITSVK
ncbi:S41 family peptidase [Bacillus solimangrovi]|uniref:PDZ domain-containing protein n=1 Tax=Bacillus solimangrovi TaxID=1305675 RepID=A0A1E5LDK2_9BACI|nr:S41 family peptidase [Bacillus solimangrovi]OEH92168.1 hypothetical protein BFG57_02545 [Bacillus solimangrovi]